VREVIGISDSIDDTAAIVFARSFYAAVASPQSVASAVEQAKVQMLSASVLDSDQWSKRPPPRRGQVRAASALSLRVTGVWVTNSEWPPRGAGDR